MVFVTGVTSGIGRSLVQKILSVGMECCAIVRDIDKAQQVFSETENRNFVITNYEINSFMETVSEAINLSDTQSKISEIILILNAFDISPIKMAKEFTKEEVNKNINFNIAKQIDIAIKVLEFSHSLNIPLKIINLDSGAAYQPISGWSLYCAGKAYLNMFLRVFSQENNVPLVLYEPGVVDTKMQECIRNSSEANFPMVEKFRNYHSSGQLNSPDAVAQDIFDRYLLKWTANNLRESFNEKK